MSKEPKHIKKFRELHLKSNEDIVAWGNGYIGDIMGAGNKKQYNGVLIVTKEIVAFYRKGLFGEVNQTIPLTTITSIERKSNLGHRTICLHTNNDDLTFKTFEKMKEDELIKAIEFGRNNDTTKNDSAIGTKEKLKMITELKEEGIISEEEFNLKKGELLSNL